MKNLLKIKKNDLIFFFLIFITSLLTVFDLFVNKGRSANMDGIVHTLTPALFHQAMSNGEFPVSWIDGFANYGLPLGIIAHQLTTYATAFLTFFTNNPVTAFNILAFLGVLVSNIFFYVFLRIYFKPEYAFAATFLFNFAPYRILNLYIRGAMPEFFASVFIPLLLICVYMLCRKRSVLWFFLLSFSLFFLVLTHPFILVVSLFLILPFLLFNLYVNRPAKKRFFMYIWEMKKFLIGMIAFLIVGIGMASYYIIPLVLEIKYFYYGLTKNHLTPDNYLGLDNYIDQWYYFTKNDIDSRGFFVNVGTLEITIIIFGLVFILWQLLLKRRKEFSLLEFAVFTSILIIFFTSEYAAVFYNNISALSNIQFPWRMLSALIFLPPLIAAYFLNRKNNKMLLLVFIFLVCILRFPQLYGKNYTVYPNADYLFTANNLHATVMNTVWSGRSEDYPIKKEKVAIFEGKGTVDVLQIKNSLRLYKISAETQVKMVDYTFYFPGWNVYVDGKSVPIEYQDLEYRGVITYVVPKGFHTVKLVFEDTKIRFFAKVATIFFVLVFSLLFLFRKKVSNFLLR